MDQIEDIQQFHLIDIKKDPITEEELDEIRQLGEYAYEDLFNKRAQKFKTVDKSNLADLDYRQMILSEYTYLKRPVIIYNAKVFAGNAKATISAAIQLINT
jgi:arsenate reductase-like glutaredoxin family protein